MTLTKNDLSQIKEIFKIELKPIKNDIKRIREDINMIKVFEIPPLAA